MSAIVVMDIGKTNAKLCVVNAESGKLVSSITTENRTLESGPYPHLDTGTTWKWYLAQLQHLNSECSIDYIVVTAHGATAALLDDNGLVLPVMDYEFSGLDDYRAEYDELCDPFERTYSPRLPLGLNVGRQLYWQRKRLPSQFQSARYLLPYTQYWSWLLTGKPVSEVTTIGSHTDLWNPVEKTWSDFARREGFAEMFPTMMTADQILGPPSSEVMEATGIGDSCQVLVGIHDSNASLIPWLRSREKPFTVMSTGTWVIIFAIGTSLQGLPPERDTTANVNIHSEPVACARFMGGREFAAIAGDNSVVASMEDVLRLIDEKIIAMPAFAEAGGPYPGWVGEIRSVRELTERERYALASLYCALVSDESLHWCRSAGDIIVEGAFAKNKLLLSCLAVYRDQQSILASTDSTGTTMGAAMLVTRNVSAPQLQPASRVDDLAREQLLAYRRYWHGEIEVQQPGLSRVGLL
ncbi:hypothetical protein AB833_01250 [Chromatiales bacterium (ex Bugula neritina AB1)]|nr:hypothetical protein AB833_01250 [Chromatiales bacterium (ex Bugula neritina AB1)]